MRRKYVQISSTSQEETKFSIPKGGRIGVLLLLFTFMTWSRSWVIDLPLSMEIYYAFWAAFAVLTLGEVRFHRGITLFLIVASLSLLWNLVDARFQSGTRLLSFAIMLLAVGGWNQSSASVRWRNALFRAVNISILLVVNLSFLLYPLGLFLLQHDNGLYKGLLNHSMLLGPVAGVSTLLSLHNALSDGTNSGWRKIFWWSSTITSFLCCLLAGSRGALGATLGGVVVLMFLLYRRRKKALLRILFLGGLSIALTTSWWMPYLENMQMKQESNELAGGTLHSREHLWNDRWAEFEESPIWGSGFAAMNLQVVQTASTYNEGGGIEPGSSWLFLLSSMGVLGFLIFANFSLKPWMKQVWGVRSRERSLLLSTLALLFIHMLVEGYVTSSGGFLFLYLWLCLGLLNVPYLKSIK